MDKKRVLVVDDEPDIVGFIKMILEDEGFSVVEAFNGEDAITKAHAESPGVILLDINMPRIDGYQICRLLKNDEKTRGIPVIMVTARTQKIDKYRGEKAGADGYITKPFQTSELIASVRRSLQG